MTNDSNALHSILRKYFEIQNSASVTDVLFCHVFRSLECDVWIDNVHPCSFFCATGRVLYTY